MNLSELNSDILIVLGLLTLTLALTLGIIQILQIVIPLVLPRVIELIPLEKDLIIHLLNIKTWHHQGLYLDPFRISINHSKLSLLPNAFYVSISIPDCVQLVDFISMRRIGRVTLPMNRSLVLDSKSDFTFDLSGLCIHFADEGIEVISRYIKSIAIGGFKEVERIKIRANFTLDINIMGIVKCKGIKCGKTIWIGESERLKTAFRLKMKMKRDWYLSVLEWVLNYKYTPLLFPRISNSIFNEWINASEEVYIHHPKVQKDDDINCFTQISTNIPSLLSIPLITLPSSPLSRHMLPNPTIQIAISPGISTLIHTSISFSRIPGLSLEMGGIEFDAYLNNHCVAHVNIQPFTINARSNDLNIRIVPALATQPVKGGLDTIKSVLCGLVSGLLGEKLGEGSIGVGARRVKVRDSHGLCIEWVGNLVELVGEVDLPIVSHFLKEVLE